MSNSIRIDPSVLCLYKSDHLWACTSGRWQSSPYELSKQYHPGRMTGGHQLVPIRDHCYPTCHMPLSINDLKVSNCQAWEGDFVFLTNMTILHEAFADTWIDSSSSNPLSKLQSEELSKIQIWPCHSPALKLSVIPPLPIDNFFSERNSQEK